MKCTTCHLPHWLSTQRPGSSKLSFTFGAILCVFSCFERFFRHVNTKEGKLSMKRRGGYVMDDLNLIGVEYLWRVWQNHDMRHFPKGSFRLNSTNFSELSHLTISENYKIWRNCCPNTFVEEYKILAWYLK